MNESLYMFNPLKFIAGKCHQVMNYVGWKLVLASPMHQDIFNCQRLLRQHDCDIARSPYLTRVIPPQRRVPEEKELFNKLYEQVSSVGQPDFARYFLLFSQARRVIHHDVIGDFAEVGVYRGNSARLLLACCEQRILHLFDTFQGQPNNGIEEIDTKEYVDFIQRVRLDNTSLEVVQSRLGNAVNVEYHVGYFPQTATNLESKRFALVHLDADQYQSIKDGCEFFFPRISPGGVLICHDYGIYHGVKKAIDEYFLDQRDIIIEYPDAYGSVCIIKRFS